MTDSSTTNIPGWYADPTAQDQLRFWDGTRWTREVMPREQAPAGADSADTEQMAAGRQRNFATAILGVFIVLFAVGGFYEVVSGNSSGNSNPNRFATTTSEPAASLGQTTPARLDCTSAKHRLDATAAIGWLASKGVPATTTPTPGATTATTASPAAGSACSAATFTDARHTPAAGHLWAYPTGILALQGAVTNARPGTVTFAQGFYVVQIDPWLAPFRADYDRALKALVAQELAQPTPARDTAPPTTSAEPQPAPPP